MSGKNHKVEGLTDCSGLEIRYKMLKLENGDDFLVTDYELKA